MARDQFNNDALAGAQPVTAVSRLRAVRITFCPKLRGGKITEPTTPVTDTPACRRAGRSNISSFNQPNEHSRHNLRTECWLETNLTRTHLRGRNPSPLSRACAPSGLLSDRSRNETNAIVTDMTVYLRAQRSSISSWDQPNENCRRNLVARCWPIQPDGPRSIGGGTHL